MTNVFFVVWRESLEAVLIIGILHSYLKRQAPGKFAWLYSGVFAGIAMSGVLAWLTAVAQNGFDGRSLEIFQASIFLFSALLMTQMVLWMNRHGRKMKAELESGLKGALEKGTLWGVASVAALAITREGAETVVYLYGLGLENRGALGPFAAAAFAGFVLAIVTAAAVARGIRVLDYRRFFQVTSIVLLFSAAGLLVSAVNQFIELGLLPSLVDPVWNTSSIIDTRTKLGALLSNFTGYRPRPSLMLVLAYGIYWAVSVTLMRRSTMIPQAPRQAAA